MIDYFIQYPCQVRAAIPDAELLRMVKSRARVTAMRDALRRDPRTNPNTPESEWKVIVRTTGPRGPADTAMTISDLLKDSAPAELIQAVRAAAAGDAYLSPGATRHVVDQLASGRSAARGEEARRRLEALSTRELEVLALLGEGLSNADAGERIHVSEATVKTYVSRILTKLRCENRVQAALLARDAGLGPS